MTACIVMYGDNIDGPGGIATVARTYREAGLLDKLAVVYLSTYDGSGPFRQLAVMWRAVKDFVGLRLSCGVSLAHIHTASRGSFWRSALLAELARLLGVPFVLHIHSGEFVDFFEHGCGGFGKRLVRRTFVGAAGVVCLTPGWKSALQAIAPQASLIALPNPVWVPDQQPETFANAEPCLLFLGRVTEKKGFFDLLQAMPSVLADFPDVRLMVAGDGELDAGRQLAKRLGIESAVLFMGWIDGPQKEQCLSNASLVVVPSHFEAFGVSILEAMAHGKPVVATRVGGVPEVVRDGLHGVLVPPRDPAALAGAVKALLANPDDMRSMGVAAFHHALDDYSAQRVTDLLASYYQSWTLPANALAERE